MMDRVWLSLFCVLALGVQPAMAGVRVGIQDGPDLDYLTVRNDTDCATLTGILAVDFSDTPDGVVIDTERGGLGAKDPYPITVEEGQAALDPVMDGDHGMTLKIGMLPAGARVVVSFDMDDTGGWWPGEHRVVVTPDELQGTAVTLTLPGHVVRGIFGTTGHVTLPLPDEACRADQLPPGPFDHVPSS